VPFVGNADDFVPESLGVRLETHQAQGGAQLHLVGRHGERQLRRGVRPLQLAVTVADAVVRLAHFLSPFDHAFPGDPAPIGPPRSPKPSSGFTPCRGT